MHNRLDTRVQQKARELALYAFCVALLVWALVVVGFVRAVDSGRVFEADFVQFFVIGSVARDGRYDLLASDAGLHAEQVRRLPKSAAAHYPPVYGPHVALAMSPLARLPFFAAYAAWGVFTVGATVGAVLVLLRRAPSVAAWPYAVAAAVAAYPPLAYAVFVGQLSVLALLALCVLAVGLRGGLKLWAGVGVGLLGYKLSLFSPALAICLLSREWMIAAVAGGVAGLQLVGVAPIVGAEALLRFLGNTLGFLERPEALAARPQYMASFRTFWAALVPEYTAWLLYAVTAAFAVGLSALAWRRTRDPLQRVGALGLGISLAAPHLYFYDLLMLVPAYMASAELALSRRAPYMRTYLYFAFLAPIATPLSQVAHFQPMTLALAAWLLCFVLAVTRSRNEARTIDSFGNGGVIQRIPPHSSAPPE